MGVEFKLNDKEWEKAQKFMKKHRHKEVNKGAIGGHISINFTMTSIGDMPSIKCDICGKEENITNYENL